MLEKASGVYLYITDNSIYSAGVAELNIVVPMLTIKGKLGMNLVDASTAHEKLGYDIAYNSNYYGLDQILSWVTQAYVWRINQGATIANAYWQNFRDGKKSLPAVSNSLSLEMLDGIKLAVGQKNPGNWGNKACRFKATYQSQSYAATAVEVGSGIDKHNEYHIEQEHVASDYKDVLTYTVLGANGAYDIDFFGGFVLYDAAGINVIGVLRWNEADEQYEVYKVAAGMVKMTVDDTHLKTIYRKIDTDTTPFDTTAQYYTKNGTNYEAVDMTTTTDWALGVNYYLPEQVPDLAYTGYIGTATIDEDDKLSLTLLKPLNSSSYWSSKYINSEYTEWTLQYATYEDHQATDVVEVDFSTNSESDIFYDKVDFGEVFIVNKGGITPLNTELFSWFVLENGSNGENADEIDPTELETVLLADIDVNVLLFNGFFENRSAVNAIATYCASKKIHAFVDVPLLDYYDAEDWKSGIINSEYVACAGRADKIDGGKNGAIFVYPSVKYAYIYSQMINNQGNLNYPPAGYTYGNVPITELVKLDYANYGNKLKTNRINYLLITDMGSCMWEQRTTYSLMSDLSYISSVFILDALSDEIVTFERQFNFRFISVGMMGQQQTGLEKILDKYVEDGFIYSYDIQMPPGDGSTGREYTIKISIRLAKDAEVININLILNP